MVLNSFERLRRAFSSEEKPVSVEEFNEFWNSLPDSQRKYYKFGTVITD